jgi:hypothetical protein
MDVTALALFAPVKKLIDAYRYLFTGEVRQWKDALVILGSFALGTAIVFLVGESSFVEDLGLTLNTWADYVLTGITLGGLAGVAADLSNPTGVTIL